MRIRSDSTDMPIHHHKNPFINNIMPLRPLASSVMHKVLYISILPPPHIIIIRHALKHGKLMVCRNMPIPDKQGLAQFVYASSTRCKTGTPILMG